MKASATEIMAQLEARKADMEAFLSRLVEAESPSREREAQEAVFRLLIQRLEAIDWACTRFPGKKTGGYLLAKPRQREKGRPLQLLIGHGDTVWPRGTLRDMPLHKEAERLKGPGVFDMKAGLTQILFALEAVRALEIDLSVTPVCLINADEEIGSRESTAAIRRLARIADRAYILEPPLGLEGKLKTARKGLGRFTLTVRGQAAHAGLDPGQGASAILELSHQVQRLFALNDHERGISVNVGMVEGGESANVVAPMSRAVIDVRAPDREAAREVEKRILGLRPIHPDTVLEVEGSFGRPPMEPTPRNQRLWKAARREARKLELELGQAAAGGGSDANTTSQYTATLDGLGTPGDGAHAKHEFIFLDQLSQRTALLVLLLALPPQTKPSAS